MTSDAQPHFFDGQISTLIDACSESMTNIGALAQELSDEQWVTASPCPGWTVGDIVGHVVALERQLVGDSLPAHSPDWAALPHVRDDEFSRFMEMGVDARRGSTREAVVTELVEVIPRRDAQLRSLEPDPELLVSGPAGSQVPLGRIMRMRVFDLWIHEQDIRSAINQPGHEATQGAHITAESLVSSLPMLWGKKVGAQPGQSLRVDVSGGISFSCEVEVDEEGRAGFVPLSSRAPTARVELDWLTYVALGTGRSTFGDVSERVNLDGNLGLAQRALEFANIAP